MADAPKDDLIRSSFATPGARQNDALMRSSSQDDGPVGLLYGHAAVVNQWTEIRSSWEGNFMERLAPGFATKTVAERGPTGNNSIVCLWDHGMDPVVGNKVLGRFAVLREDDQGLYYEVPLLDTSYCRDLEPGLRAGLYGASFRFQIIHDSWQDNPKRSATNPAGIPERTIQEIKLAELGPVCFPAYQAASAGVRGRSGFAKWASNEPGLRPKLGHNSRQRALAILNAKKGY